MMLGWNDDQPARQCHATCVSDGGILNCLGRIFQPLVTLLSRTSMYPFSAIASAIAVYQLNSMVGNECVQYARGVQNAEKDGDIVIGELDRFQKSLINLKGMLAEDEEDKGNTSCLEHLDEVMDGTFVSLRIC